MRSSSCCWLVMRVASLFELSWMALLRCDSKVFQLRYNEFLAGIGSGRDSSVIIAARSDRWECDWSKSVFQRVVVAR